MANGNSDSSLEITPLTTAGASSLPPKTAAHSTPSTLSQTSKIPEENSPILRADVLACRCPECGYPLSVRMWLAVADCWQCGLSIAITEEWLRQNAAPARSPVPLPEAAAPPLSKAPLLTPPPCSKDPVHDLIPPVKEVGPEPTQVPERPVIARFPVVTSAGPRWDRIPAPGPARSRARGNPFYDWLNGLPAWLLSFLLHLLAMILLGLLTAPQESDEEIVLSLRVGAEDTAGAEALTPVVNASEFDEPGEPEEKPDTPEAPSPSPPPASKKEAESLAKSSLPPSDLQFNPVELAAAVSRPGNDRMVAGRDPRVRAAVVAREGGTEFTEAAVARGLFWLANHQNEDGSWSLNRFASTPLCGDQCSGSGGVDSDMAATSLALLPFLGAGQTHLYGQYRGVVARGLAWLLRNQRPDGDMRGEGSGRMYAHGQCTIVLCEALAMTKDKELHEPCRRAVQFILDAQHEEGGWRYEPGEPGDTSVFGWQLMALQSARQSGFRVPQASLMAAGYYLDSAQTDSLGGRYSYQPGQGESVAMTAEAALCRQYLGWTPQHKGLRAAASRLLRYHPPKQSEGNIYYWYYATQFMHHMGGENWRKWNLMMRSTLVEMQETVGHEAGSWSPESFNDYQGHATDGGRIYTTSLAVCTLETYYRHLPLFRGVDVSQAEIGIVGTPQSGDASFAFPSAESESENSAMTGARPVVP